MHNAPVLIVDDREDVRRTVARLLALAGVRSEPAACAESALERLSRGDISLVLVDLMLDDEASGTDLLAAIRGMDPDLPVVFITGNPHLAEDHPDVPLLMKPLDPRALVLTVKREIHNRCRDLQLRETRDLVGQTHKTATATLELLSHPATGLQATHALASRSLGDHVTDFMRQPLVRGLLALVGVLLVAIGTLAGAFAKKMGWL